MIPGDDELRGKQNNEERGKSSAASETEIYVNIIESCSFVVFYESELPF